MWSIWSGVCVCVCVCACPDDNFWTKWPLTEIFAMLLHLDPICVKLEGQGFRLKFMVTGWKMFFFAVDVLTWWRFIDAHNTKSKCNHYYNCCQMSVLCWIILNNVLKMQTHYPLIDGWSLASPPLCQISPPSVQRVASAGRKTSKSASE